MIDPISALGIAAAITQFIAAGNAVATRLIEYNYGDPLETPRSLQNITAQLPLLIKALEKINKASELERFDTDTRCILRGTVQGALRLVEEVELIALRVRPTPGENFGVRLRKAMSSLKSDTRIVEIDRGFQAYIQVLILYHVVDGAEVKLVLSEEDSYFEVPHRFADDFVYRDGLVTEIDRELYSTIRGQSSVPQYVILKGQKGVGKTQLALEYCTKAHSVGLFKTIFWLDASSPETLKLSLEGVSTIVRRKREGSREEKLDFFHKFFVERWHPWLLVLDNYNHKAFLDEPVNRILPQSGTGGVIVTTTDEAPLGPAIRVPKFLTESEQHYVLRVVTGAVQEGDIDKVRSAVEDGFDLNQRGTNDFFFLHRAAIMGHEDLVKYLLEAGADPYFDISLVTPLAWAAGHGYNGIVTALLDHEDKTNTRGSPENYRDAIGEAIEDGYSETVKLLLSRRDVKLDMSDGRLGRGFERAASKGHVELYQLLYQYNAFPKSKEAIAKALNSAAQEGWLDLVKFFVSEAKVDPNVPDEYGNDVLSRAVNSGQNGKNGDQSEEMVSFLLSAGASPDYAGGQDSSPLIRASLHGKLKLMEILLKAGADPKYEDQNGYTALLSASKYKTPESFPLLVNVDIKDIEQRAAYFTKALNFAARTNDRDLALAVLKVKDGADIDSVADSVEKSTALMLAIKHRSIPVARFLVRRGAKQDIRNQDRELPLLVAASRGLDLIVKDLLKAKDSLGSEVQDKEENTPLILAARGNYDKTVRVLLEIGADKDAMNQFGETALDVAEEKNYKKVIDALEGRPEQV